MGCVCGSKEQTNDNYQKKSNKTQTKMKGKGIQIGGGDEQFQNANQNELIAQAAEKRLQNQERRGMNHAAQIEYEFKKKKLEEAEQYEKERRGENYNLRWN
ncbi:unnamed protein product [Paramecium pentaurelia]|uniref:Uncharacterized protein n=1 Tax=Paramecium pentaurelia TaxID=43138 RepID=A0A8S1SXJ9_9CILI|nr:unnamed protein product [Paramecium pentaurelia]